MGCMPAMSASSADPSGPPALPNPDPRNYEVVRHELRYPDCTNYEGRKILVYRRTTLADLERQGSIDPHFAGNPAYKSPFARFEPTREGWAYARALAHSLY